MSGGGFERTLLDAFAATIAENPAPRVALAWRPDGTPYPEGVYGIHRDLWPQLAGPSLTLATYTVDDAFALADSTIGMQVTIRDRDRTRLAAVSDDLFDLFHGRSGGMLGAIELLCARRASATSMGQDSNGRLGRSENYYLAVHRPSPHRI